MHFRNDISKLQARCFRFRLPSDSLTSARTGTGAVVDRSMVFVLATTPGFLEDHERHCGKPPDSGFARCAAFLAAVRCVSVV